MIAHSHDSQASVIGTGLGLIGAVSFPADSIEGRILSGLLVTGLGWALTQFLNWLKSKVTK
jgi:hypothetical protein